MNKINKIIECLLWTATFVMPVSIQAQDTAGQMLNLTTCIHLALKNNTDVQRSIIQSEIAHLNWQQRKANMLPVLNASVIHGINQGRGIDPLTNSYINQQITYAMQDLNGSVLLFNGMALQNLIRQSSQFFQASKQQEQQVKDELVLNLILVYLQVLTNKDLLDLSYKQQETTSKQVERLKILNEKGAISPEGYYDLKGQFTNDQLSVVNTKNTLENSKLLLTQLLNIDYNKNLQLEKLPDEHYALSYDEKPEQIYQTAVQNLAMVKAADLLEKSARTQVKSARSGYYPSIYLRGGLTSNFSNPAYKSEYWDQVDNNLGKSVNISIVIPLFNSFKTNNAVSLAKINHRETQLLAQSVRTELQQLIAQAYFNMMDAQDRYNVLKEQVDAFSESFRSADNRFNLGAINSVDYLVSKNNLEKAKISFVVAGYDFILRKKILDFYQGKPLF